MKVTLSFLLIPSVLGLDTARFYEVVAKLESHVLAFRNFMESLYADKRCDVSSLAQCESGNYHECTSALANPTCPAGEDFEITDCGDGCSGWESWTNSVYRLAPNTDITDPLVIEAICYSRLMDEWLIQRIAEDKAFWDEIGIDPRAMYYGTKEGAFRIFPGRPSETCGTYDAPKRPWFGAGSSGPKNVVLVLDISSSMEGARMSLMKQAAIRVIETLTISDRVAIVLFDNATQVIAKEGQFLYEATAENKDILIDLINGTEAGSGTNIYEGLEKAFDILDASSQQNEVVNCNSGILFLTDGIMTRPEGIGPDDVIQMVQRRLNATTTATGKPVLLFTYSVSEQENVHEFPKMLSCSVPFGIWSKIPSNEMIVEALASYYLFFAMGLGSAENSDFTAWVEPYLFRTGNILGTTVSAPVYDRSKSPPLFLGVVAIDIILAALNRALQTEDISESIKLLAQRSVEMCPAFEITQCELDWLRHATGGQQTRCRVDECGFDGLVQTTARECTDSSIYPSEFNANNDNEGISPKDRICCGCAASKPETLSPTSMPTVFVPAPTTEPEEVSPTFPPTVYFPPPTAVPVLPTPVPRVTSSSTTPPEPPGLSMSLKIVIAISVTFTIGGAAGVTFIHYCGPFECCGGTITISCCNKTVGAEADPEAAGGGNDPNAVGGGEGPNEQDGIQDNNAVQPNDAGVEMLEMPQPIKFNPALYYESSGRNWCNAGTAPYADQS